MLRIPSLNLETRTQPATIEETFARATQKRRRLVYMAIPGTIGLGLLVAVVYVGGRVVSGRSRTPAPVKQAAVVVPPANLPRPVEQPPAKVETKPKIENKGRVEDTVKAENQVKTPPPPKPVSPGKPLQAANTANTANTALTLITPRPGETYLQ
ncbi:MAG TPA: hypothetical protein VGV35_09735, partial [Bryobacteraceae bacterium]|nr:hypothetical protein [Bryobacteraceae bacterium]